MTTATGVRADAAVLSEGVHPSSDGKVMTSLWLDPSHGGVDLGLLPGRLTPAPPTTGSAP